MTASSDGAMGIGWVAGGDVEDTSALVDVVLALFAGQERTPTRMTYSAKKATTRAFQEPAFRSLVADPAIRRITVWSEAADGPSVRPYLRDDPASRDTACRQSGAVIPGDAPRDVIDAFVSGIARCGSIVAGVVARYPSADHAIAECWDGGLTGELDADTDARLTWDAMYAVRAAAMPINRRAS